MNKKITKSIQDDLYYDCASSDGYPSHSHKYGYWCYFPVYYDQMDKSESYLSDFGNNNVKLCKNSQDFLRGEIEY